MTHNLPPLPAGLYFVDSLLKQYPLAPVAYIPLIYRSVAVLVKKAPSPTFDLFIDLNQRNSTILYYLLKTKHINKLAATVKI